MGELRSRRDLGGRTERNTRDRDYGLNKFQFEAWIIKGTRFCVSFGVVVIWVEGLRGTLLIGIIVSIDFSLSFHRWSLILGGL